MPMTPGDQSFGMRAARREVKYSSPHNGHWVQLVASVSSLLISVVAVRAASI